MRVDRSSLKEFYRKIENLKGINQLVSFLFRTVLADTYFQTDFQGKIVMMMARKSPEKMTPDLTNEFLREIGLLLWILGPVWVANREQLPVITLSEFREAISNEAANDWDEFYSQFREYDPLWQDIIDDKLQSLTMSTSRIIVGRIARIFLERLPDPVLAH